MKQKKLLLLGGLQYLLPVIEAAHRLGHYVITCDYIPENIAHRYADEYHNVSITNKEAVLKLAAELQIDGIMSFAVDPGVLTAAYVAEKLHLPSPPYGSVKILQDKSLFRNFLKDHRFNVPMAKAFRQDNLKQTDVAAFRFPVMVKPVDAAGSKGVTRINDWKELDAAAQDALQYSFSGKFIIEEYIEAKGFPSDTDCFSVHGEMKFCSFSNQYFDKRAVNPFTPSAFSWPSTMSEKTRLELQSELQRLVKLLNLGTSIYNVEVREGVDGKAYIMEMSPRGGGNRLSEVLKMATGVDLIENAVKAALGDEDLTVEQKGYNGYWAEIILHANEKGIFKKVEIDPEIKEKHLVELDLWVKPGDTVYGFDAANKTIGTVILKFDSWQQLNNLFVNRTNWLKIIVK